MTKEDKELLLKDLSGRLPYKVKVYGNYRYSNGDEIVDDIKIKLLDLSALDWFINGIEIKPYLRPMSSMTEEEEIEYDATFDTIKINGHFDSVMTYKSYDWLNEHHFDFRGLIEKGLAIEVTEENNPYNLN